MMKSTLHKHKFKLLLLLLSVFGFSGVHAQVIDTIYATGTVGSYKTGSVNTAGTKNDGLMTGITSSSNRGWAVFDLSSIPGGSTINSASILFKTTSNSVNSSATNWVGGYAMTAANDPATVAGSTLYTLLNANATTNFNASSWTVNAFQNKSLNAAGVGFLSTNLGSTVVMSFVRGSTNNYEIYGYDAPTPEEVPALIISYIPSTPCAGIPTAGTVSGPAAACAGVGFTLDLTGYTAAGGITFQWEESPAGANMWTPVTGATSPQLVVSNITAATDYRVVVTCINGGQSDISPVHSVALNPVTACYCTPVYTTACTVGDDIDDVILLGDVAPGINNLNTPCPTGGYQDFTNMSATLSAGSTYSGNVTTNYTSTSEDVRIWIDYDANGVFDAAEEIAALDNLSNTSTGAFSFTVPASANAGTYRMRVRLVYGQTAANAIDPCISYTYGEAHDYTVNIIVPAPCSGIPTAGTATAPATVCLGDDVNLGLSGFTLASGINIQWEQSPAGANMWTAIPGATTANYVIVGGQTAATDYRALVTCVNGGQTDISNVVSVAQSAPSACYCTPVYTTACTVGDDIDDVILLGDVAPGINNLNTPCPTGGYQDFTSMSATLSAGSTYTGNVTTNYTSTSEDVRIWIDYDANGVFDAAEEIAALDNLSNTSTGAFSFTVPASANAGTYRMRVRLVYGQTAANAIDPCISYTYGEAHDYTVNIIVPPPCSGAPTAGTATAPAGVCLNQDIALGLTGYTLATGINIQWEQSPAGANTWSPVTGATTANYVIVGGQTAASDYRAVVTCINGGLTDISNTVSVAMNPFYNCYCTATNMGGSQITNVTVTGTTMNHTSGTGPSPTFYTAYPDTGSATATLVQGVSYPVSLTFDASSIGSIWIDYNQDGIFDATEWIQTGTTGTSHSATLTVPMTALTGLTGMRVRSRGAGNQNGSGDACLAMGGGETHDYLITIAAAVPCSGQPVAGTASGPSAICAGNPFDVTVSGSTIGSGIVMQWQESPAGANTWTNITGATSSVLSVASQTTATDYRLSITCTNGGLTDFSNVVSVAQNAPTNCYCIPTYSSGCTVGDDINSFVLNGDNGTSFNDQNTGCSANAYDDRTAQTPVQMAQSLSYNGSVTANYGSGQNLRIWIDFGDDGIFDATDEVTASSVSYGGSTPVPFTISIPLTATLGNHRMRVRDVYSSTSFDACMSTFTYGETHDYTVTILPAPTCLAPGSLTAANVTSSTADVNFTASTSTPANGYEWRVFPVGTGPYGTPTTSGTVITGTTANITGLTAATDYTFHIRSVCSATDTSNWTSVNFTTACATVVGQYTQSFNTSTTPNCWTNSGPEQWLFSNGAGPGYGVAGSTDHTGNSGYFAWVDGSGTGTNQDITLTSVPVDISGFAQPTLSYYMKSFNNSDGALNKLIVEVLDGSTWVQVDSVQMNYPSNAWYNRQVSLSTITATTIQVRFVVDESNVGGSAFNNDLLIDDVQILATPLAIELVDIRANNAGTRNQIVWVTGTDEIGDIFEVERSADGRNFSYIGTVAASGEGATYTFWDESPVSGTNYYRLKMVDVKGTFDYSRVVNATVMGGFAVKAYPNPVTDLLHVTVTATIGNATVTVSDITGKTIRVVSVEDNKAEINMAGIAQGVYLIKYSDAQRTETIKVNKQ